MQTQSPSPSSAHAQASANQPQLDRDATPAEFARKLIQYAKSFWTARGDWPNRRKMNYQARESVLGRAARWLTRAPEPDTSSEFSTLRENLLALAREIRRRAPHARILMLTYPNILPPIGTCASLGISEMQANRLRDIAARLADITSEAALTAVVELLKLSVASTGHDACARDNWVNGAS
jgi:hypothetical protein